MIEIIRQAWAMQEALMIRLSERLRSPGELRAAARTLAPHIDPRLKRWPRLLLERYVEGRLDDLAASPSLPVLPLLQALQQRHCAIEAGGHWHPLFLGRNAALNERIIAKLNAANTTGLTA